MGKRHKGLGLGPRSCPSLLSIFIQLLSLSLNDTREQPLTSEESHGKTWEACCVLDIPMADTSPRVLIGHATGWWTLQLERKKDL